MIHSIDVDKYQAAYLQAVHDETQRVIAEAKQRLVAALEEVRKDVDAPEDYFYDGYKKCFMPMPEEPEKVAEFEPPQPEPEGV